MVWGAGMNGRRPWTLALAGTSDSFVEHGTATLQNTVELSQKTLSSHVVVAKT